MEIKNIQVTTNTKGETSCGDLGISSSEWYNLLKDPHSKAYHNVLFCILRMPMHKSSCKSLSEEYGKTPQHYNSKVIAFAQWAQKSLNRFKVVRPGGKDCYWTIPMFKGKNEETGFVWYLRDELVEALQRYLLEDLIERFRLLCNDEPFNGSNEIYKWEVINKNVNASTIDIIKSLRGVNIVSNQHVDGVFKNLIEANPTELVACINHLFDETKGLNERIVEYKSAMKNIALHDSHKYANDERTAAGLLTCKYPEKYAPYMDTVYQLICYYFGIAPQKVNLKYNHFMSIINGITNIYGQEIQDVISNNIASFKVKPLPLATQTLFWCMQDEIKKTLPRKIWLVGAYIGYETLDEKFKKEKIWSAQFNDDSKSDQDLLDTARTFKKNDIIVLKSTGTKGAKHDQSFIRIKGIGIITDDIEFNRIEGATIGTCSVTYVASEPKEFEGSYYGTYNKMINILNHKHKEIVNYIYAILEEENMEQSKYDKYVQLLSANKNLILTGAPGTGKTYMAQKIAEAMNARTEFVQFHPSYDYTDFVEGLRPVQEESSGQIGFKRMNGVFKEFCKEAAQNLMDSQKTIEILKKEQNWNIRLNDFVTEAIEDETKFPLTTGNDFKIVDCTETSISIFNEHNPKTPNLSVSLHDVLQLLTEDVKLSTVGDIRRHFKRKFRTQPDSYAFVMVNELRKKYSNAPENETKPVERKDFVFIIDEINRGEASKIFGELFYAIDPGYRATLNGDKGKGTVCVQTQYQNLVPEGDVFANGFFVPDNVYILGTMNDIDRSVESMDFAMRRRFIWKEVTPTDTEYMLNECLDEDVIDDALASMHRLNDAISNEEELGAAYMIGPSYFLKLKDYDNSFEDLWSFNLEPLLKEYLRGIRKSNEILDKFHKAYFG